MPAGLPLEELAPRLLIAAETGGYPTCADGLASPEGLRLVSRRDSRGRREGAQGPCLDCVGVLQIDGPRGARVRSGPGGPEERAESFPSGPHHAPQVGRPNALRSAVETPGSPGAFGYPSSTRSSPISNRARMPCCWRSYSRASFAALPLPPINS